MAFLVRHDIKNNNSTSSVEMPRQKKHKTSTDLLQKKDAAIISSSGVTVMDRATTVGEKAILYALNNIKLEFTGKLDQIATELNAKSDMIQKDLQEFKVEIKNDVNSLTARVESAEHKIGKISNSGEYPIDVSVLQKNFVLIKQNTSETKKQIITIEKSCKDTNTKTVKDINSLTTRIDSVEHKIKKVKNTEDYPIDVSVLHKSYKKIKEDNEETKKKVTTLERSSKDVNTETVKNMKYLTSLVHSVENKIEKINNTGDYPIDVSVLQNNYKEVKEDNEELRKKITILEKSRTDIYNTETVDKMIDVVTERFKKDHMPVRSPYDHEFTVIVKGITYEENENCMNKVKQLLNDGLGLTNIIPVRALRTRYRTGINPKPGLFKIELSTLADKITVLKNTHKLSSYTSLGNHIHIWSSQSFEQRVAYKNSQMMIQLMGEKNHLKVNRRGLLIKNPHVDNTKLTTK